MDLRSAPSQPAAPAASWGQRLIGRWWRRQTPARQDRFATLAPLVSVLLFLAAIVSAFWTLRNEEFEREAESVKRDAEIAQQQIRLHLIENHEQLVQLARQIVTKEIDAEEAQRLARAFGSAQPEVMQLTWLDALRRKRASYVSPLADPDTHPLGLNEDRLLGPQARSREAEWAFIAARDLRQPVYSRPFKDAMGTAVFQTHVPLLNGGVFAGALIVEYSIEGLLRYFVPPEVKRRRAITVLDESGRVLASTVIALPGRANPQAPIVHDVPLTPTANGVVLRAAGYRTSVLLIGNTLFWMVLALSGLTLWMLLGTWRHMRRRAQIQGALVQETNFRRAMENSMLTGMRAMDLEGRITYVNPAFCAMTGYAEAELIGRMPPYPYWPPERVEENSRLLQQELQGRSPAGGIEVRVMRKDGVLFDARMYVSPLIDARGKQTGWMTSMTNITEAKRIRDQLSASHERFTTVLEGLDAAGVGVVGAARRVVVRQPFVPAVVWRRRTRPFAAGQRQHAAADLPRRRRRSRRRPVGPAGTGAHQNRRRPARGVHRIAEQVVRRALALPAVDRWPPRADADRHRCDGAPPRRGAGGPPGREGARCRAA